MCANGWHCRQSNAEAKKLRQSYYYYYIGVSSVENLELNFKDNPSLNWSPPSFYSDDIPQGSVTTYDVYVESEDRSVIADVLTTDTFYQLPNNLTDCYIYTASVRAIIQQYSSPANSITEQNGGSKIISVIDLMSYCYIRLYY